MDALSKHLSPPQLLLAALALLLAVTGYCLAYTAFAGQPESPGEAAAWTIVNVLPWAAAFELGKRIRRRDGQAAVLAAAFLSSLVLGVALGEIGSPELESVRRIPGLLLTVALLAAAGMRTGRRESAPAGPDGLPLAPGQIEWVAAAGNYVELHGCGRTIVRRASLGSVLGQLSAHGFVRIHRSLLVRGDCIARIRPTDVVLRDGTSLKTGHRYRAALQALSFVPSSQGAGEGPLSSL
jgi:hypothetical protein